MSDAALAWRDRRSESLLQEARLIRQVGEALYGTQWQTDMAWALHVSQRTVQRWRQGHTLPAPGVWADLARLCATRGKELERLALVLRLR